MRFASRLIESRAGRSKQLAVFVHGWRSSSRRMLRVVRLVQDTLPEADCLLIDHEGGGTLTNVRPEKIADQIAYEIDRVFTSRPPGTKPYESIVLIAHSTGSLLLKKAYAFACGYLDDSETRRSYDWAEHVDRIVCLAGVDRGLPLAEKTDNMSATAFAALRVAYATTRFLHLAQYFRSLQRGAPFVSNLRVQWIRMMQDDWFRVAPVYQLVGDRDDLVTRSDSVDDLLRSKNYVYRSVINANHEALLRPGDNPYAEREIVYALTAKPRRSNAMKASKKLDDVYYVIHGIRDLGRTWTYEISKEIHRANAVADPSRKIRTVRPSYGYFSMLSFLLAWDRQENVRWFMDLYTQMIARYPHARHHYVGHSNGTYILAAALKRYATCRVRHVVFAGSVVPSAFDWTRYKQQKRVAYVRNDVGSADWVVGVFPHIFELLADMLKRVGVPPPHWTDLGAAGFNGFLDDAVTNNTWLPGGHNAAMQPANFTSIAQSVVSGRDVAPLPKLVSCNGKMVIMSKFAWLFVPVVAAVVVADVAAWKKNRWLGAGVTSVIGLAMYTL